MARGWDARRAAAAAASPVTAARSKGVKGFSGSSYRAASSRAMP